MGVYAPVRTHIQTRQIIKSRRMSKTYPKVIDTNNINCSIKTSNNIDFIQFSFQVYENANVVDETWESYNNYTYTCPLSKFTYYLSNDADTGVYNQLNLKFGNSSVEFNQGEYVDLNGDVFDLGTIVGIINTLLTFA
jgi:hypothetical protein